MQHLKTENCVICGKRAECWHGHVIGLHKYALGYAEEKVAAGFCKEHKDYEIKDETGFYGKYNSVIMGECIPFFSR